MHVRTVVLWSSFLLAIGGWGGSLWSWLDHGAAAGVNPGFITALSVGITFTIVFFQTLVMPDKARMFGLGVQAGINLAQQGETAPVDPQRRLRAVR